MDSYEWNKIAGWVLAAAISVLGLSILTGYMFPVHLPKTPAYVVEGVEAEASAGPAAEAEKPMALYMASADVTKGEAQFKKCASCHTIEKGGAAGIGPNLYGIVGNVHAHTPGFAYSAALAETKGKVWDWEGLGAWLANPKKYLPGNKMSFAGISKPEDRANLLAYLNAKSDKPLPMPAAATEATAAETAAPEPAAAEAPAATGTAATAPSNAATTPTS